jgi:hypothetical protein
MTPCPTHPQTPKTHLGCCSCHGLLLAKKDKGARPNWHRSKRAEKPEAEARRPDYDSDVSAEVAATVSTWGAQKQRAAAGL